MTVSPLLMLFSSEREHNRVWSRGTYVAFHLLASSTSQFLKWSAQVLTLASIGQNAESCGGEKYALQNQFPWARQRESWTFCLRPKTLGTKNKINTNVRTFCETNSFFLVSTRLSFVYIILESSCAVLKNHSR